MKMEQRLSVLTKKYTDGIFPNGQVTTSTFCIVFSHLQQADNLLSRIFWKGSNNVVDLSDHGNPENGTAVTIWSEWEGQNQLWSFEEV